MCSTRREQQPTVSAVSPSSFSLPALRANYTQTQTHYTVNSQHTSRAFSAAQSQEPNTSGHPDERSFEITSKSEQKHLFNFKGQTEGRNGLNYDYFRSIKMY